MDITVICYDKTNDVTCMMPVEMFFDGYIKEDEKIEEKKKETVLTVSQWQAICDILDDHNIDYEIRRNKEKKCFEFIFTSYDIGQFPLKMVNELSKVSEEFTEILCDCLFNNRGMIAYVK